MAPTKQGMKALKRLPPTVKVWENDVKNNVLKEWIKKADGCLRNDDCWNIYRQGLKDCRTPKGTFALARHYQLEASVNETTMHDDEIATPVAHRTRSHASDLISDFGKLNINDPYSTPTKETGSHHIAGAQRVTERLYPPTKDAQIVNTALVIFLNALTKYQELSVSWTMHRMPLVATFTEDGFQARTDGYLYDRKGNLKALIEVKPVVREIKRSTIRMQESAQMVAWILGDENGEEASGKLRLIISQDRHEIFISMASYDADYIDYLKTGSDLRATPSLLAMHEFGPWNTLDERSMSELGKILLAISLRADYEAQDKTALRMPDLASPEMNKKFTLDG
ncbi:hypothetical protein BJX64DRAFT_298249 [Aspergillus heterothallicus]